MAIVHEKNALAVSGLNGMQSAQRDWSPYLVHFTSWTAMIDVRKRAGSKVSPKEMAQLLATADSASLTTAKAIISSGKLLARSPSDKAGIPACVCLSECNIGGLISHAERYGRYGFVFRKNDLFDLGARPCLYLDEDCYRSIAKAGRTAAAGTPEHRLFGLSNKLVPKPKRGRKVQEFTHEREWRSFAEVAFAKVAPRYILAPSSSIPTLQDGLSTAGLTSTLIMPLDTLFEWGA